MNNYKPKIRTILLFFIGLIFFISSGIEAGDLRVIREKTFSVKQGETLGVDVSGADVKIESRDVNEVYVKILGNRRAEDKMNFRIDQTSSGVEVEIKRKGSSWFNWGGGISLRVEVTVPRTYNTDVNTSGGDINLSNVKGTHNLKTSGGDVELDNTNGRLYVKTSGGDIILNSHTGESELTTSGGDIVTRKQLGDIKASTSGGNVELETQNGKVSAKTSGGSIKINYTGTYKGIKATTSGGGIRINVPKDIKATVQLATSGGSIDCDFSNSRANKVTRSKYEAEFNGGGEELYAKTSGGSIYLKEN